MKRLSRFVVVGGVGFLTDAAVLLFLQKATNLPLMVDRVFSIAVALTVTWLLNRTFTFGPSDRPAIVEGARYGTVGVATSVFNYMVFVAVTALAPQLGAFAALVIASAAAMALSFSGYSRLVFTRS